MLIRFCTIGCLFLMGCSPQINTSDEIRPVKVVVAQEARSIIQDFVGMATASDAVNLTFKVSGQILDLPVSEGEHVEKGQLIAQIDPRDIQRQVRSDQSAFEEARSRYERAKRLLLHQAISEQEYESTKARFIQMEAKYKDELDLLNETKLYAPFQGIIERKYADDFERIEAGRAIVRLVNPRTTTVKFTLSENSLALIQNDSTQYSVEFDKYQSHEFQARLKSYVATSSDASGYPISLRLIDVDTAKYHISPGMSCTIHLRTAEESPHGIVLPLSAIYAPQSGGNYVWVVGKDDRVEKHIVQLGELFGRNQVSVGGNITQGDRVVVAGVYQLHDDERVKIIK